MQEAGIHYVRVTEFTWSAIEPSEGVFDLDWIEHAIRLVEKHHIAVVLGTPTACTDTRSTGSKGRVDRFLELLVGWPTVELKVRTTAYAASSSSGTTRDKIASKGFFCAIVAVEQTQNAKRIVGSSHESCQKALCLSAHPNSSCFVAEKHLWTLSTNSEPAISMHSATPYLFVGALEALSDIRAKIVRSPAGLLML